ncbi:lipase maturation factor 1-like isoform X1 [Haliotis rufescens]|uniref:lipase maturation factor 1-like isoform X1 n=1 Tax=Haliotis rufescens TaxID=6454 RepID=UPI00201F958C|nr:lipase maturation factor 1-like isoform X1 [Haliotis rufescens]
MSDARAEREFRGEGVRKRRQKNEKLKESEDGTKQTVDSKSRLKEPENNTAGAGLQRGTFWLTRIVLLRYIGFIYFVAFLVALHQNKQLIGKDGLLPANKYLNNIKNRVGGIKQDMFIQCPSIIWLFNYNTHLDQILDSLAYTGLALSLFLVIRGAANWFIMLALWVIYHSIVSVGQQWFSFGWESQLLETGFLAIFLCPVWNLSTIPQHTPTSLIIIWAYRWLIFRIMLGAGLIKIRGDQCWRDLTCMNYHYETQPVPNPLSYYLHQSPELIHKMETLSNHFIELVAPFFLILGRRMTIIGGGIQIFFQVVLITSGNLSFLNWLTIVPSLACFDDRSLSWMFSGGSRSVKCQVAQIQHQTETGKVTPKMGGYIRRVFNISFGLLIAYLSVPVVQNLLSQRQAMNTSFDSLRLVNTYGAFGSVTKERTEVIIQGTSSSDPSDPGAKWLEYEFKCKPGNIKRRPCIISPYHYRMDWLAWFAAFQNYQYNPWLVHAAMKLLINDEGTTSLIAHNPFEDRTPPKFIRVEHYRYVYTKVGSREAKSGAWWRRKHIGNYLPPISLRAARDIARQMDWDIPRLKRK